MTKQINVRKKDTYFVTHGLGSITALKYIEMIDQPIEGFFSIAGFKEDAEELAASFARLAKDTEKLAYQLYCEIEN